VCERERERRGKSGCAEFCEKIRPFINPFPTDPLLSHRRSTAPSSPPCRLYNRHRRSGPSPPQDLSAPPFSVCLSAQCMRGWRYVCGSGGQGRSTQPVSRSLCPPHFSLFFLPDLTLPAHDPPHPPAHWLSDEALHHISSLRVTLLTQIYSESHSAHKESLGSH
jgi:hypothetical protein